jgi:hypothetical protein
MSGLWRQESAGGWVAVTHRTRIFWSGGGFPELLAIVEELIRERAKAPDEAALADLTLAILTLQTWIKINGDYEREGRDISGWFVELARAAPGVLPPWGRDESLPLIEYMRLAAILDGKKEAKAAATVPKSPSERVHEMALQLLTDGVVNPWPRGALAKLVAIITPKFELHKKTIQDLAICT